MFEPIAMPYRNAGGRKMKKLMTFFMVLTLASMAQAQEGILEAFVANSKELSFGTETELNEGNLLRVGGFRNRPQGCTRDQLERIVGYNDFCYVEIIEGYHSRPVKNTFNRWFGLAEVAAAIQEDLFYNNSGRLKQIWYHVEIPGILPQAKGNKFGLMERFQGFSLGLQDSVWVTTHCGGVLKT